MKAASNLDPNFKEFLSLLVDCRVEFALVGGYAEAYHGYPRFTGDMDILVRPSAENSDRIVKVLERIGMGSLGVTPADLIRNKRATGRTQDLLDLENLE